MRRSHLAFIIVALALSLPSAMAQEENTEKDGYIFLSQSGNSKSFEIKKYSRVTLSDNAFILTPRDASLEPVTLSYNDYRKLQFGHYVEDAGVGHLTSMTASRLCYDKTGGTVTVTGENGDSYLITICSVDGKLLTKGYGQVDLSRLPKGIYMAMAANGNTRHILKFHK